MLDFSDTKGDNDIIFKNSSEFKIRNLLKTEPEENYYYPDIGIDISRFYEIDSTMESLKVKLSKYLTRFLCFVSSITISQNTKGISEITISSTDTLVSFSQGQTGLSNFKLGNKNE